MQHVDEFQVEVQPDFIEKITRAKPLQALSELVWNALDADAREVRVYSERNEFDLLPTIRIHMRIAEEINAGGEDGETQYPQPAFQNSVSYTLAHNEPHIHSALNDNDIGESHGKKQ